MSKPDTTPNAEALRQQLQTERSKRDRLNAENASLQAFINARLDGLPPHEDGALLTELASALISARHAGRPAPGAQTVDGQAIHRPKPGSRPPSGGNPRARQAHRKLHESVRGALDRYGKALERGFEPLTVDERFALRLAKRCSGRHCIGVDGVMSRNHRVGDHIEEMESADGASGASHNPR